MLERLALDGAQRLGQLDFLQCGHFKAVALHGVLCSGSFVPLVFLIEVATSGYEVGVGQVEYFELAAGGVALDVAASHLADVEQVVAVDVALDGKRSDGEFLSCIDGRRECASCGEFYRAYYLGSTGLSRIDGGVIL